MGMIFELGDVLTLAYENSGLTYIFYGYRARMGAEAVSDSVVRRADKDDNPGSCNSTLMWYKYGRHVLTEQTRQMVWYET